MLPDGMLHEMHAESEAEPMQGSQHLPCQQAILMLVQLHACEF